jgi:hypothetical protein
MKSKSALSGWEGGLSKEAKRIEEIKATLESYNRAVEWDEEAEAYLADTYYRYSTDIPFLLKRVEELEKENKSISISETHHATLLSDCEMENERLRTRLQKRDEQLAEIQKGGEFGVVDTNFTGRGGEW